MFFSIPNEILNIIFEYTPSTRINKQYDNIIAPWVDNHINMLKRYYGDLDKIIRIANVEYVNFVMTYRHKFINLDDSIIDNIALAAISRGFYNIYKFALVKGAKNYNLYIAEGIKYGRRRIIQYTLHLYKDHDWLWFRDVLSNCKNYDVFEYLAGRRSLPIDAYQKILEIGFELNRNDIILLALIHISKNNIELNLSQLANVNMKIAIKYNKLNEYNNALNIGVNNYSNMIYYASKYNRPEILKHIQYSVQLDNYSNRYLIGAAKGGNLDYVKDAINRGAQDLDMGLLVAISKSHIDIVNYLIDIIKSYISKNKIHPRWMSHKLSISERMAQHAIYSGNIHMINIVSNFDNNLQWKKILDLCYDDYRLGPKHESVIKYINTL